MRYSRHLFFLYLFSVLLALFARVALADSFDMEKDGKKYHCEQISEEGGGCWDKCPYGFESCKQSCGGGEGCWSKCPYGFESCQQSCGQTRGCWDKCPYGFESCKQSCGGGDGCWSKCPYGFESCNQSCGARSLIANARLSFELSRYDRVKAEAERLRASRK
jgi:hypothetical protein